MLDELLSQPDKYVDFEFLSYWQVVFNSALAIMVFFAWVKVGDGTCVRSLDDVDAKQAGNSGTGKFRVKIIQANI